MYIYILHIYIYICGSFKIIPAGCAESALTWWPIVLKLVLRSSLLVFHLRLFQHADGNASPRAVVRRREWEGPNSWTQTQGATHYVWTCSRLISFIASSLEFRSAEFFGTHDNDDDDRVGRIASANAKDMALSSIYSKSAFAAAPAAFVFFL